MTPEELQWKAAAKRGRKAKVPYVLGTLAFVLVTGLGFTVEMVLDEMQRERYERGEVVVVPRNRPRAFVGILLLPVAAGALAFVLAFKLSGGKIPKEYVRGFNGR